MATPLPTPATFAARVRRLRETAPDLSQRELDGLAGLHAGHVWQIEEGNRENPTRETLRGLCRVFGVSLDWLAEGAGKAPTVESVCHAVARVRPSERPAVAAGSK
jgi:transcriptional regulator with XRE-family HTH domain